jgi:hypothetical protein
MLLVLFVILIVLAGGGFWGYRSGYYGVWPFGGLIGVLFLILIIWLVFAAVPAPPVVR